MPADASCYSSRSSPTQVATSSDIEECSTKKDNCHVDANCTNTKGSVDTLEMEPLVLISRNVQLMLTTVMLMLTALISKGRSTARVRLDILEMESLVLMWTSVFLVRYLLNIYILLITVMLMPTVQTPKDHSTARVLMVILVMGLSVLISTNVTHLDCHLIISTWLTFVIMMLTAQTQTDPTIAHAGTDTLEMD